jgi:tellurite resistance protein TerA
MQGARHGARESFKVELNRLPGTIKRLVFTAAMDGGGTMSDLANSWVDIVINGSSAARYSFSGSDFGAEKALMVFEIYMKDVWRYAAVGQGFNGGLSALLKHFGGEEVGGGAASPAAAPPAPAPAPAPAAAPAPAPAPKVNLGKVTLDKKGSKGRVSLDKGGGQQHPIHVNLNWDNPNAGKRVGFLGLGGKAPAPDLDLGCMFRLANGDKGVIQPLGERFGSRHAPPYIYLDKDDRTGAASDGENLYIMRPDLIDTVMIFAMVYEGTATFADVNARLTIKDGRGSEIFIPLNSPSPHLTFCSICLIQKKGNEVEITKEEHYVVDHQEADMRYRFGFRWVAGSK